MESDVTFEPSDVSEQTSTSSLPENYSDCATIGDVDDTTFFDTYYSHRRIAAETIVAVLAILFNLIALSCVIKRSRSAGGSGQLSNYHCLFVNLVAANVLATVCSWLSNNALVLFHAQLMRLMLFERCTAMVYLSGGVCIPSAIGTVSTLTLLGFTLAQLSAIRHPLRHNHGQWRRFICYFILLSWFIALAISFGVCAVVLAIVKRSKCTDSLYKIIGNTINISAILAIVLVTLISVVMVALFLRIQCHIDRKQRQLAGIRCHELYHQKRALLTTILLTCVHIVVFLPYSIIYVVSLTKNTSQMASAAKLYYMMFIPYVKFLLDPLIYGFRLRDIQNTLLRLCSRRGRRDANNTRQEIAVSGTSATFVGRCRVVATSLKQSSRPSMQQRVVTRRATYTSLPPSRDNCAITAV